MSTVRVLLVDDHTMVRRGLRKILESTDGLEVIDEAGDGAQAVQAAVKLKPDIVLMDVGLPGMNGIEATRRIAATVPEARVLMLSIHADEHYVQESLAAGAKGYLLKDVDAQELVTAIIAVSRGDTYRHAALGMDPRPGGQRTP